MKLKATELEIPSDNPFRNDVLGRKPMIEKLSALVQNVSPPFVMCIDAPWGMGKTTFLRLWEACSIGNPVKALRFNAWTTDFAPDPLVAFVSEITALVERENPSKAARSV